VLAKAIFREGVWRTVAAGAEAPDGTQARVSIKARGKSRRCGDFKRLSREVKGDMIGAGRHNLVPTPTSR